MSSDEDAYELEAPAQGTSVICQHCGAEQKGFAIVCWLCKESSATPVAREQPVKRIQRREPEPFSYSLATMFLLMALASVCMGLLVVWPGLGIFACVVMVPVFIRTIRVVKHRESLGEEISSAEKAALFLGSFAVSSVLVVLVCVSAFCSFCGVCLTVVSFSNEPSMVPVALGVGAIGVGVFFVANKLFKWNQRRYRREMDGEL
jgi:hypothetical protein